MTKPSLSIGASMDTFKPLQGPKRIEQSTTLNPTVEGQEQRQNKPISIFDQTVDTEPIINKDKKQ